MDDRSGQQDTEHGRDDDRQRYRGDDRPTVLVIEDRRGVGAHAEEERLAHIKHTALTKDNILR